MAEHDREHDGTPRDAGVAQLRPGAARTDAGSVEIDAGEARPRGIYLLPNLITTGALFSGFFAIVAAMNGRYETGAVAIFVAGLLDTADGRVARLTRTESEFGAQYDSLSDLVAFGVAPALVVFAWSLQSLGQLGWVAAFVYVACAALRLARFNMHHDNAVFTGLASPAAAGILAFSVWALTEATPTAPGPEGVGAFALALLTLSVGLLMVAPIEYWSPKQINLRDRVPFITLVLVVLGFAVVLVDPPRVLLAIAIVYAFSGPVLWLWRGRRGTGASSEGEPVRD